MLIGELAKRTCASPKALRLYESRGLLAGVTRRGTYRVYTDAHLQQVQMIRQARALGLTLAELSRVLVPDTNELDWHVSVKR